jgi:hypothetical protein
MTPEQAVDAIEDGVKVMTSTNEFERRLAQSYAKRVWAGQSSDLHRKERLARVEAALKAQGLSMEGVEL